MKTYDYLNDKIADIDRRVRRGENLMNPLVMSRMRIGNRVAVINRYGEVLGIGSVIKASPSEVEVPMCGEYMVFNLEDSKEWTDGGYYIIAA